MQVVLEASGAFFNWLSRATWQASIVVVLVLGLQWLLRDRLSPRWRHALWLLVMLRLLMPWSIESRVSIFNAWPGWPVGWGAPSAEPGGGPLGQDGVGGDSGVATMPTGIGAAEPGALRLGTGAGASRWLPATWLGGVVLLSGCLIAAAGRLAWKVRRQRPLTDGSVLDLLEDCKQAMGVRTPLSLVELPTLTSPCLFGWIRPRLLLPAGFTNKFTLGELRYVFLHELAHVKRGDIPLNWLAMVPLTLHWFNPLVWFALARMRSDSELASDALVLSCTRGAENQPYGQTIIKLIESFSRPAAAPGLVGILENNQNQMKRRISMISKFRLSQGWPVAAAALFVALGLVTLTDAQTSAGSAGGGSGAVVGGGDPKAPPRIVATSPKVGETEVDPSLAEITVTFDRDMGGGFSWTGGGADYPPTPTGQKAQWRDKRTAVLPVKLQAAHYYRVGINSTSYQNFRSADGVPARPSAIYFTTRGASEEMKLKTAKPEIVSLTPANGATDVDPGLGELRITFNVPMAGGFSWTGGGPEFPVIPLGKKPFWSPDHKTCVLPVSLKPGSSYRLGLNSPSHKNFQSAGGVPLEPVSYTFKTR